jgi:hypothetical protein
MPGPQPRNTTSSRTPGCVVRAAETGTLECTALRTLLIILLVLLLLGALPAWPYSSGWGYYPSSGALVLLILLLLVFRDRGP